MQALSARPPWLKKSIVHSPDFGATAAVLKEYGLNTVCQAARCPNIFDCFSRKIATFLILGDTCTRNCGFCAVKKGESAGIDADEPRRIAEAVSALGLDHVVITSVTRDDLPGGGAGQFVKTIEALKNKKGHAVEIEALVPDFKGDKDAIKTVIGAQPDIFSHNVETVPRLYRSIRPQADYKRSLEALRLAKEINPALCTKSGIMVGFGETKTEVVSVMADLRNTGCDIFTVGQYMRPSTEQTAVERFVTPGEFLEFKKIGLEMGFRIVESGPFVRSSYRKVTREGDSSH